MDTVHLYAWAAGLLDADGTITIKRARRYARWYYIPLLQMTQVATYKGKKNIARLQKLFGGNVKESGFTKVGTPEITWQATSKTASECIRKILPFMAGKVRQAETLMKFYDTFHGSDYKFHRITEKEREQRDEFFLKMRSFQEKGLSPTTTEREDIRKDDATV